MLLAPCIGWLLWRELCGVQMQLQQIAMHKSTFTTFYFKYTDHIYQLKGKKFDMFKSIIGQSRKSFIQNR